MTKRILTLALTLGLCGAFVANAVPAKRGVREIQQPDGTTVKVELVGDEHFHYYQTAEGSPMLKDSEGFLRFASQDSKGEIVLSARPVELSAARRLELIQAMQTRVSRGSERFRTAPATSAAARANSDNPLPQSGMGLTSTGFPTTGDVRALVVLVQYSDVKFTHPDPAKYFGDMLNLTGFNEYNGTGCATEYFLQQSGGQFRPQFDIYGPVTLPKNRSYYGGNDSYGNDRYPEEMALHAAEILDSTVDFSLYDMNNDGKIDNMFLFYAGQGEASYGSASTVWPHSWDLSAAGKATRFDGVVLDHYACTNEWEQTRPDGVGTFIHEFSHVIGLPDLYQTAGSGSGSHTPGSWSVLDYGPYNNDGCTPPNYSIYERNAMGWINPQLLDGPATIVLENIGDSNEGCIIQTEKENEFFLLENRQLKDWDKYLPGHGMLIWHIDYVKSKFDANTVNNTSSHSYVDIVEACGSANNNNETTMAGYSWPGTKNKTSFTSTTTPALKSWAGKAIDLPITEITEKNQKITFNVAGGKIELTRPTGLTANGQGDGTAVISWNEVNQAKSYYVNLYTRDAVAPDNYILRDFETKDTSITVEGLNSGETYYVTVQAVAGSCESEVSAEVRFVMPELAWIYITPETTEETEVSQTGFTLNWNHVDGAVDYLLTLEAETGAGQLEEVLTFGNSGSTTAVLPEGWSFTAGLSNVYRSNSVGYFGDSAPALKFSTTGHTLTSPLIEGEISSVGFWLRGASGSESNVFSLQGRGTEDEEWSEIQNFVPSSTAENIEVKNLPAGIHQIRFVFTKVYGNAAFDDLHFTYSAKQIEPVEGMTDLSVGYVNTFRYDIVPTRSTTPWLYYYSVKAVNAGGEVSRPSATRSVKVGDYTGAADIEIVDTTAPASYYNLQGLRVERPSAAGIYIRMQGGKATKVLVR